MSTTHYLTLVSTDGSDRQQVYSFTPHGSVVVVLEDASTTEDERHISEKGLTPMVMAVESARNLYRFLLQGGFTAR